MNNNIQAELDAIRWAIRTDCQQLTYVSQKQIGGLNHLLREVCEDRETKIAVLKILVGEEVEKITNIPVNSTKNLTSPVASYLINQLKEPDEWRLSKHGRELLESAKELIQRD